MWKYILGLLSNISGWFRDNQLLKAGKAQANEKTQKEVLKKTEQAIANKLIADELSDDKLQDD